MKPLVVITCLAVLASSALYFARDHEQQTRAVAEKSAAAERAVAIQTEANFRAECRGMIGKNPQDIPVKRYVACLNAKLIRASDFY